MAKDASKEIEKLTEKIKELEETIEYERKEKDKIAEEKDKIVKKFEKVKKEFEEFKAKHSIAVTNLCRAMNIKANSRNVSKPFGAPNGLETFLELALIFIALHRLVTAIECFALNSSNSFFTFSNFLTILSFSSAILSFSLRSYSIVSSSSLIFSVNFSISLLASLVIFQSE